MKPRPLGYAIPDLEPPVLASMTVERLIECQHAIGWSNRQLAEILDMNERQVRRWRAGSPVPPPVAAWLERLAHAHQANPAPAKPPIITAPS